MTRSSQEIPPPQILFYPLRDDFAVAASSFRSLMAAMSRAFVVEDKVAGLISIIGSAVGYNIAATVVMSC